MKDCQTLISQNRNILKDVAPLHKEGCCDIYGPSPSITLDKNFRLCFNTLTYVLGFVNNFLNFLNYIFSTLTFNFKVWIIMGIS